MCPLPGDVPHRLGLHRGGDTQLHRGWPGQLLQDEDGMFPCVNRGHNSKLSHPASAPAPLVLPVPAQRATNGRRPGKTMAEPMLLVRCSLLSHIGPAPLPAREDGQGQETSSSPYICKKNIWFLGPGSDLKTHTFLDISPFNIHRKALLCVTKEKSLCKKSQKGRFQICLKRPRTWG